LGFIVFQFLGDCLNPVCSVLTFAELQVREEVSEFRVFPDLTALNFVYRGSFLNRF